MGFRTGNALLAVHINSIKGRDQLVKQSGPSPLRHLGVTFSESGLTATLWETSGSRWKEYTEIDGDSSYQTGGVEEQCRGKGFNLGHWYPEYDWVAGNGFANFATWIG